MAASAPLCMFSPVLRRSSPNVRRASPPPSRAASPSASPSRHVQRASPPPSRAASPPASPSRHIVPHIGSPLARCRGEARVTGLHLRSVPVVSQMQSSDRQPRPSLRGVHARQGSQNFAAWSFSGNCAASQPLLGSGRSISSLSTALASPIAPSTSPSTSAASNAEDRAEVADGDVCSLEDLDSSPRKQKCSTSICSLGTEIADHTVTSCENDSDEELGSMLDSLNSPSSPGASYFRALRETRRATAALIAAASEIRSATRAFTAPTVAEAPASERPHAVERMFSEQNVRRHAARIELQNATEEAASKLSELQQVVKSPEKIDIKQLEVAEHRLVAGLTKARELGIDEECRAAEAQRRQIHDALVDARGQVRVFCRVRPLSEAEVSACESEPLRVLDDMQVGFPDGRPFIFDRAFAPGCPQEEVFEACRDLVQSAIDGRNVTIFCYGQTGSGKTHTMYGRSGEAGLSTRVIDELYHVLGDKASCGSSTVTGSMVEIHNNCLVDLLKPENPKVNRGCNIVPESPKVSIRSSKSGDVRVDGLSEEVVAAAEDLQDLLDRGMKRRARAPHALNADSSRSHSILTVKVTTIAPDGRSSRSGKIILCDLGGSERLKRSRVTGSHQKESIEINKSLSALGDVIDAAGKKSKQVPYRNHKLTQLLQDSLGGTAKTIMIVTCSPSEIDANESVRSLQYASRVSRVINPASAAQYTSK